MLYLKDCAGTCCTQTAIQVNIVRKNVRGDVIQDITVQEFYTGNIVQETHTGTTYRKYFTESCEGNVVPNNVALASIVRVMLNRRMMYGRC